MSIHQSKNTRDASELQNALAGELAPTAVQVLPSFDGPILTVTYNHTTYQVELTEDQIVTGEQDVLEAGDILVEIQRASRGARTIPGLRPDATTLRYIHGFAEVEHDYGTTVNADYTLVYPDYTNRTSHNEDHLTVDPDGELEFFIIRQ